MKTLPLAKGDYRRGTQHLPPVPLVNRYSEAGPVLNSADKMFIARPGLRRWVEVGIGPIRKVYSQPGAFNDDLFVVSYDEVFRVNKAGEATLIFSDFMGERITSAVEMVATLEIDAIPSYLFFCAGRELFVYDGTTVTQVVTPEDVGVKSIGLVANYVIVVPAQGQGMNGRFWWIEPAEITIDPLNFATAEAAPDPIYQVVVVGDQFWLPGQSTTEVWYFTGDAIAPVMRFQGRAFERGVVEGTATKVKDTMMIVDNDGAVYAVGGEFSRVSDPSIEERIRKALNIHRPGL